MGRLRQAQTSIACSLGNMLIGILWVWPSYTLQHYTDRNTTILHVPMTEVESSMVGSLPALGAMLGTVVVGWILSTFGRQKCGLISVTPLIISWLVINFTKSSVLILLARFVSGVSSGVFLVLSPIFISEVAEESIRGTLASAPMAFYCVGTLISYILGWTLSYHYVIWTNIAFCLLYTTLMATVTESPLFLMRRKREEEARAAIARYKGMPKTSKIVLDEFTRLKQMITPPVELLVVNKDENPEETEKDKLNMNHQEVEQTKLSPFKMLFMLPSPRRTLTVVGLTMSIQVLMGMVAVQVYAKNIFTQAAPSLSSHFCSVMFALVLCLGSLFSTIFADRFGRKILLAASSISVALCLVAIGAFIQTTIVPPWVTALLILCFCFAFMFGAGSVPYILTAEVFIPEVQSIATMLLMEWVWFLNFLIIGIYPLMVKLFGVHGSFYAFACFALTNVFVTIFLLPETKGLTIQQIQEAFLGRRIN